ncbi:S-protein-like protein 29 [Bienertia sinuspersici]
MLFVDVIDAGIRDKVHVRIINALNSQQDLQIHCKSKDDDLGVKIIPYGSFYEFKFGPSIFGNTLYYCGFVFDKKLHWFDIYVENRDTASCWQKCWWMIKEPRPCLLDYYNDKFDICYDWKA